MAKLSLSSVLEARKRIRITTILATFLLIFLLLQGLIFNNPKSTQAAQSVDVEGDSCQKIKLNSGSYMIDENNIIWSTTNQTYLLLPNSPANIPCYRYKWSEEEKIFKYNWNWGGVYVNNRSITVGDGVLGNEQATLTFTGNSSAVNLKSFTIKSDGVVSHIGPGSTAKTVDKPAVERFGIVLSGYFYSGYDPADCSKNGVGWQYSESDIKKRDLVVDTNDGSNGDKQNPISAPRYAYKHYNQYDNDTDWFKIQLTHPNIIYSNDTKYINNPEINDKTITMYHSYADATGDRSKGANSFQDGAYGDFMSFTAYLVNNGNSNFFINFIIREETASGDTRDCKIPISNFYSEAQTDGGNIDNKPEIIGDGFSTPPNYNYPPGSDYPTSWSDGSIQGENSIPSDAIRTEKIQYRHFRPRTINYNEWSFDRIDTNYRSKIKAVFYHDLSFIKDLEDYTVQNSDYTPMKGNYTDWEEVYKPLFSPDRRSSPLTILDLSDLNKNDQTIDSNSYLTSKPAQKAARISWTEALPDTTWQNPGIPGQREVNLNITEDLTIESGGKIDVSGKGFRGGGSQESSGLPVSGYGYTSDSGGKIAKNSSSGAGGGAHGGHGGSGNSSDNVSFGVGGKVYDNYFLPGLAGSGGGGSLDANACYGGPGGGVVKITAGSIDIRGTGAIIADGLSPSSGSSCGAGAGGTIQVQARNSFTSIKSNDADPAILSAKGGQASIVANILAAGGDGGGGRISLTSLIFSGLGLQDLMTGADSYISDQKYYTNVSSPRLYDTTNFKGDSYIYVPVISERGTVYVSGGISNNVKKVLKAVSRGSVTDFNPYALQKGDIIQVVISVSNLVPGTTTTIEDVLLTNNKIVNKRTCKPLSGFYSPDDPDDLDDVNLTTNKTGDEVVKWTVIPALSNQEFSYNCQVE